MFGKFKMKDDIDDEMGASFKPGQMFMKAKKTASLPTGILF
jgi:hypothetical protein